MHIHQHGHKIQHVNVPDLAIRANFYSAVPGRLLAIAGDPNFI